MHDINTQKFTVLCCCTSSRAKDMPKAASMLALENSDTSAQRFGEHALLEEHADTDHCQEKQHLCNAIVC